MAIYTLHCNPTGSRNRASANYGQAHRRRHGLTMGAALRARMGSICAAYTCTPARSLVIFTSALLRSEEHTSELQSLMRTYYVVFCLKKKTQHYHTLFTTTSIQFLPRRIDYIAQTDQNLQ